LPNEQLFEILSETLQVSDTTVSDISKILYFLSKGEREYKNE